MPDRKQVRRGRLEARVTGLVQGVGFRYTTRRAAAGFAVTGYVRNVPDGSVECVVEGDRKEIDAFLAELTEQMSGYIQRRDERTAPATGAFGSFDIRM